MKIRLTAVVIEDGKIILLDQNVDENRTWSLPGGKLEEHETIEEGLLRELKEETGLVVSLGKLLYICDHSHNDEYVLHLSFRAKVIGGTLGDSVEGLDINDIRAVEYVPISELQSKGFSKKFQELVENDFPGSGAYVGPKSAIGL